MKKVMAAILSVVLMLGLTACEGNNTKDIASSTVVSSSAPVSQKATFSESENSEVPEESSNSNSNVSSMFIPKPIEDSKSALCNKIQSIFQKNITSCKIDATEYHYENSGSAKHVINITVSSDEFSDDTPEQTIDSMKTAFSTSGLKDSEYDLMITASDNKDNVSFLISKNDSGEWTSAVGSTDGPHSDSYKLAYEKSSFFSKMDSDKQYEDDLDSIKEEYGVS